MRLGQPRGSSATGVLDVGHTAAMSPPRLRRRVATSLRGWDAWVPDGGGHHPRERSRRAQLKRELRALVPKGSHRLHFRHDRQVLNRKHLLLIAEGASAGVHGLAAHAVIASARHEGRARVRCLAALATHLSAVGADEIVIESRQPHRDVEDDRTCCGPGRTARYDQRSSGVTIVPTMSRCCGPPMRSRVLSGRSSPGRTPPSSNCSPRDSWRWSGPEKLCRKRMAPGC